MTEAADPAEPRYVLDTSALIDLKNLYPPHSFPSLWDRFNALVDAGVIIAPREVRREIEAGTDELNDWVKDHSGAFLLPTAAEGEVTGQLQQEYPNWVDPDGHKPMADPFVLSMAKERDLPLVTHDRKQLLHAARQNGVECIKLPELIEREGWQF